MIRHVTYGRGHQLAYTDAGSPHSYPVLVQHGLIAGIEDVDLFEPLLRLGTRVISIARPGYGQSTPYLMDSYAEWARIVSALIDDPALSRFDVLAMSSGAPYGYALAAGLAGRVRNLFVFSGMPALYDAEVLADWPHKPSGPQDMPHLQQLARTLFFSGLPEDAPLGRDVRDSMANDCFGVAQDMRLRFLDWGFSLSDIEAPVYMRHSRTDSAVPFATALRTSRLLPRCRFEPVEYGPHFSREALEAFIRETMAPHYPGPSPVS